MSFTEFQTIAEELRILLVPLLFFMVIVLYKLAGITLKLHINDKAQDLKIDNIKDGCTFRKTI